jgi:hypothetical protein
MTSGRSNGSLRTGLEPSNVRRCATLLRGQAPLSSDIRNRPPIWSLVHRPLAADGGRPGLLWPAYQCCPIQIEGSCDWAKAGEATIVARTMTAIRLFINISFMRGERRSVRPQQRSSPLQPISSRAPIVGAHCRPIRRLLRRRALDIMFRHVRCGMPAGFML